MLEGLSAAARDRSGQAAHSHPARLSQGVEVGPHRVGRGHEAAEHQDRRIARREPERRHHQHAGRALEGLPADHDLVRVVECSARLHPALVQLFGRPVGADAQLARGLGRRLRRRPVRGPAFLQPAQLPEAQTHEDGGDEDEGKEREPAGKG